MTDLFSSPLFVSVLLYTVYALTAAGVAVLLWSAVRSLRRRRQAADRTARRVAWAVAAMVAGVLALTGLLASTQPLTINGRTYDDPLWLRLSDMLICSSLVLIAVAAVAAVAGKYKN